LQVSYWHMFGRRNKLSQQRKSANHHNKQALQDWYSRELGQALLETEKRELEQLLPDLFGYHLLQVGSPTGEVLSDSSRISHRILLESEQIFNFDNTASSPSLWGCPDALPICSDSVDVVILPHTLEFEEDPHQVLRETDRVLVPEGHVVILGFNPWSLWGLWRIFFSRWGGTPWTGQFRSMLRIKDWLALLGYDVVQTRNYFFRPPLQHVALMKRLTVLETLGGRWWRIFGAAYLVVAKKRVFTYTPIKPIWKIRRKMMGGPDLVKPSINRFIK